MKSKVIRIACRIIIIVFVGTTAFGAMAQVPAYIDPRGVGGYGIDAKGVRHNAGGVPGVIDRLYRDCTKMIAPEYPYLERSRHHAGKGFFHLKLNLKSGAVIQATVARSTGFRALDDSAVTALWQWRWKPNLWREVEIPVTFTLQASWRDLPKGAAPIPRAYN